MAEQAIVAADPGGILGTAERLRAVRRAHGRFLALWALDRLMESPAAADRAWADLAAADNDGPDGTEGPAYSRGRRLDD